MHSFRVFTAFLAYCRRYVVNSTEIRETAALWLCLDSSEASGDLLVGACSPGSAWGIIGWFLSLAYWKWVKKRGKLLKSNVRVVPVASLKVRKTSSALKTFCKTKTHNLYSKCGFYKWKSLKLLSSSKLKLNKHLLVELKTKRHTSFKECGN